MDPNISLKEAKSLISILGYVVNIGGILVSCNLQETSIPPILTT